MIVFYTDQLLVLVYWSRWNKWTSRMPLPWGCTSRYSGRGRFWLSYGREWYIFLRAWSLLPSCTLCSCWTSQDGYWSRAHLLTSRSLWIYSGLRSLSVEIHRFITGSTWWNQLLIFAMICSRLLIHLGCLAACGPALEAMVVLFLRFCGPASEWQIHRSTQKYVWLMTASRLHNRGFSKGFWAYFIVFF